MMLLFLLFPEIVSSIPHVEILPHHGRRFDYQNETTTELTNWDPAFDLICTADYPVEWKLHFEWKQYATVKKATHIETYRYAKNFQDVTTYKFISILHFKYQGNWVSLTNFSCQSTMLEESKPATHVVMSKETEKFTLNLHISSIISTNNTSDLNSLKENCTETEVIGTMIRPVGNHMPCWKCNNVEDNRQLDISVDHCDSPTECAGFYKDRNKGALCLRSEENVTDHCTFTHESWDFNSQLFVCKNNGPKLKHSFFFGVFRGDRGNLSVSTPPLYMDWTEVDPKEMLYIHPLKTPDCYLWQEITFTCEYSRYYFALGSWFGIKHNDKMEYISATDLKPCDSANTANCTKDDAWRGTYKAEYKHFFNETGHYEIFCFGPVWNSTEWVNTSMSINVEMGEAPRVTSLQPKMKQVFKPGQPYRKLICTFSGKPIPDVTWSWTNTQISPPYFTIKSLSDYESELTFSEIGYSTEGVYTCTVTNCMGVHSRSRRVELGVPDWDSMMLISLLIAVYLLGHVCLYISGVINGQKSRLQKFTRKDIHEFVYGNPQVLEAFGDNQFTCRAAIEALPYDQSLEIPIKDVTIYSHWVLGSGAYGIVFKGEVNSAKVRQPPKESGGSCYETLSNTMDVAVKVGKDDLNKLRMKTLLAEIKIMGYLGFHKNVVGLIGASTCRLAKMELYIIMEYCHNGSLDVYLRMNKDALMNSGVDYVGTQGALNRNNLYVWAREIADGLYYMHEKRVIHADLAIRNVLLTQDLTAKVGDFGLSKQLTSTSVYTKKNNLGLPWQNRAIESLKNLEFTKMSDIWGFGVLLWELFSLDEIPYHGYSDSPEFINALESGYRLKKPKCATNAMYEYMTRCWNIEPKLRPKLNEIKGICSQAIITEETEL